MLEFTLPRPTPLLNRTLGQHWAKRVQRNRNMAWEVKIALGKHRQAQPFARARVTIERRSTGVQPDYDGLIGGMKSLIDALLLHSDRHPNGQGLITDDSQDRMLLVARSKRVATKAEACTVVRIEELPCHPPI